MSNLSIKEGYHGIDNLQVVNGTHLPMVNTGSKIISTNNSCFKLSNILYVQNVTQSLIYVSQLCQTNKVYIKFSLAFQGEGFAHEEDSFARTE